MASYANYVPYRCLRIAVGICTRDSHQCARGRSSKICLPRPFRSLFLIQLGQKLLLQTSPLLGSEVTLR